MYILPYFSENYNPRANGAKRSSGRKPGARVNNSSLAEFKVVAHGSKGVRYVMTSCSLILILWRTVLSISFDWLTRLFCSFPNHDATLTVSLKFVFCKKNAVMLEQKTQYQNAQARARARMWTEVSKLE